MFRFQNRLALITALTLLLFSVACSPDPEPEPEPEPTVTEGLIINEFLAKNDSCCADPSGDFDDWVELHNTSSSPINIGGLFITDTPGDTNPSPIPTTDAAATTIPPGGYLVIWWDDDQEQGPLHISKKLSADGESIVLLESDGTTTIDSYTFSTQSSDVSMGRSTNNPEQWVSFSTPTPGAENGG